MRLSIACPAYNEAAGIAEVIQDWMDFLPTIREITGFEVVVCNDGSRDATGSILDSLSRSCPSLKLVHHAVNQGAAAALATAITHSTGDWVLLLDADGQFPIENWQRLWKAVSESGADAAIGYRPKKEDTIVARWGAWARGFLCSCICGHRLQDFNSALKLVRGPLLRSLHLEARGLNYSTEISAKLLELRPAVKLVETEAVHLPRRSGRSSRTLVRSAWHRLLFVAYLAYRRFLQSQKVLRTPQ
jgi:dolichol-phosphate mannosyltransferase